MKKGKKKFDKKQATTFIVVNKERDSREINAGEKPTIEHVFMPGEKKKKFSPFFAF